MKTMTPLGTDVARQAEAIGAESRQTALFESFVLERARGLQSAADAEPIRGASTALHSALQATPRLQVLLGSEPGAAMAWLMSWLAWIAICFKQQGALLDRPKLEDLLREEMGLPGETLGPIITGLLSALRASFAQGSLVLPCHPALRDFLAARYWSRVLQFLLGQSDGAADDEQPLLGGRLLAFGDVRLRFLMWMIERDWEVALRDRLKAWASRHFNDDATGRNPRTPPSMSVLSGDQRLYLREVALAIGSELGGIEARDSGSLRSLVNMYGLKGDEPLVRARRGRFVGARLAQMVLPMADLSDADLSGADLSGANLEGSVLNAARLDQARLPQANLSGAYLRKVKSLFRADLRGADLERAFLAEANLEQAVLEGANLTSCELTSAILDDADLTRAKLRGADLRYARMMRCRVAQADLRDANLEGAHLQKAKLPGARLRGAQLQGAHLEGADLSEADLYGANLKGAYYSGDDTDAVDRTRWPSGFDPLEAGAQPVLQARRVDPPDGLVSPILDIQSGSDSDAAKGQTESSNRRVVILTARDAEFQAVRAHLSSVDEHEHPVTKTVYDCGTFIDGNCRWDVSIAGISAEADAAATEAERAIGHFEPAVLFLVGNATGVSKKMLCGNRGTMHIGDVVVATKVYGYEAGMDDGDEFHPWPSLGEANYRLEQRARAEARRESRDWVKRVAPSPPSSPQVHFGAIAAGEVAINSKNSALGKKLGKYYSDALAVEVHARAFLKAAHHHPEVNAIVIRGIDSILDVKSSPGAGAAQTAARHASAFAFQMLAKL